MIIIYTIYKILNLENNKFYIGMSQEFEKRKRSHLNQLRLNNHNNYDLQFDFNLYGEDNFKFIILYNFTDKLICQNKEIELINSYENIYNIIKDSSIGGDYFTNNPKKEELRKIKINQMTGKNNHQYGKPKSEKMIDSVKKANSKKIIIENKIYNSITEASSILNVKITTISYRLNSKGFENWKYL